MQTISSLAWLLGLATVVAAHGNGAEKGEAETDNGNYPPNYFSYAEHWSLGLTHIALMTLAWSVVLPVAVMLSLARSRYLLAGQFIFVCIHVMGLLTGAVYNSRTPDLYPNNSHHRLGWIVSLVVGGQVLHSVLRSAGRLVSWMATKRDKPGHDEELDSFIPMTRRALAERQVRHTSGTTVAKPGRLSHDSGHGTASPTESARGGSVSSDGFSDHDDAFEDVLVEPARPQGRRLTLRGRMGRVYLRTLTFLYATVDRVILPLGFITICTGIATYGRFFEGSSIFSGLAHWIKGSIFFWMGILTLGRWSGSFGELGWAWNIPPQTTQKSWRPSAEFVESGLIFTYGATNIFLEHLGGWGGEWTAQDLEHISITILFIGGGLCGMLVESSRAQSLLNFIVVDTAHVAAVHHDDDLELNREEKMGKESIEETQSYRFSLNPIPALVIVLLGMMMSSHTQDSMISRMLHKQWGNLLTGGSLARSLTYVLLFLRPPRSVLPSRPPTELLAAFGLMAGGVIFMASSSDTVKGMEHHRLDAMFFSAVTMGLVALIMAWVLVLLALKGWAVRFEKTRLRRG